MDEFKRVRSISLALILCLCCLGSARGMPALSEEFQNYMLQHHYGVMRLDRDDRSVNEQTVDAKINGKKVTLGVDTGCGRTALSESCARRLGLDVLDTGKTSWGVGGEMSGTMGIALIKSFTLGGCEINRTNTIMVFPKSAHALTDIDGYLGYDLLQLNGVILPVGGSGFLLKPGATPVVSAASYLKKLGYQPVRLLRDRYGMTVNGSINGHAAKLLVDSGAGFSVLDATFLREILGKNPASMMGGLEGVDGRIGNQYRFTPNDLELDGFKISPIMIAASASPSFKKSEIVGCLGVDIMGLHRGIIDFGDDILWMK